MRLAPLFAVAALALAQDEGVSLKGVVRDGVSHSVVKKAEVMLSISRFMVGQSRVTQQRGFEPKVTTTDSNGVFLFTGLAPGAYELRVMHPRYPPPRTAAAQQSVEIKSGEEPPTVTVELIPGAAISGRVLDEDGDPIPGCFPQVRPAKGEAAGVQMLGVDASNDDGEYRVYGVPAGKYVIAIQCGTSVFQPRPLSPGPPPPPSFTYPPQFYPLSSDRKGAEVIDLAPALEKSGVDFRLSPVRMFPVRGRFTIQGGGKSENVNIMLVPKDEGARLFFGSRGGNIDPQKGTFDIPTLPGAYFLTANQQPNGGGEGRQYGTRRTVQVTDRPVEVDLELLPAADLTGTIEFEGERKGPQESIQVSLFALEQSIGGGQAQTEPDGSFTIKSVLPGVWRLHAWTPNAFVKAIYAGGRPLQDRVLDTTAGPPGPVRIVISNRTGSIRGSGPAGRVVAVAMTGETEPFVSRQGTTIDSNGEFSVKGLAPGKYLVALFDPESSGEWPEEGREVEVAEGETVSVELTGSQ